MRVTIFKPYRHKEVINRVDIDEVVRKISAGETVALVKGLREAYHLLQTRRLEDGRVECNLEGGIGLPRVCFAAEYENRKGEQRLLAYNGLVVLEVNNLAGYDEAIAIREAAKRLPQTMLTFLGASGRSVKMVCRGELFPDKRTLQKQTLPTKEEKIEQFHENLYHMARKAYGAQLDVTIENIKPRIDRTVYLSTDPDLWWNPEAVPFYAEADTPALSPLEISAKENLSLVTDDPEMEHLLLPGRTEKRTYQMNYLFIIENELGRYFEVPDEERLAVLLMRIAAACLKEQIPMGVAQALTLEHPIFKKDELLVKKTFSAVYTVENLQKYREQHRFRPLQSVPEDTVLMMKTDIFLNANYEMRKNMMTGVAQYRERNGFSFEFRDLDDEARNEMTIRAKEVGLKSWDKDIARFIDSPRIEKYDPVNDFLDSLPRWDGQDRVWELAARVPTSQPHWPLYLHTWLLGMVAHWMGRSSLTGNALVPILIGRQGCGKTSFCRILLPRQLRDYYNDRINFKNETDLNLGLTSFALINIDEFDKTTARQQVLLKYLLSTADVKFRPPYGKAVKQYRRYASFIGTTNDPKPLNDPTGSRRFVCVEVTGDIDFADTLDHRQLFAQLRHEVLEGGRYWLNDDETQALISENERFQRVNGLEEMIAATFRKPDDAEAGRWMTVTEIMELLRSRYGNADVRNASLTQIGYVLNYPRFGFKSRRKAHGMTYLLVER